MFFCMIHVADYFPVVAIFDKCEHVGIPGISELRVDRNHCHIFGYLAVDDFV